MRIETREYKVYSFNELDEKTQFKVIDNNRMANVDYDWYDPIIEHQILELENIGFTDSEIRFTGFASQGDGASFTCESINLREVIKHINFTFENENMKNWFLNNYDGKVIRIDNHYAHERTVSVTSNTEFVNQHYDETESLLNKTIEEFVVKQSKLIYSELESEYDYLTSDDSVKESLIDNECEFLVDGKPFN